MLCCMSSFFHAMSSNECYLFQEFELEHINIDNPSTSAAQDWPEDNYISDNDGDDDSDDDSVEDYITQPRPSQELLQELLHDIRASNENIIDLSNTHPALRQPRIVLPRVVVPPTVALPVVVAPPTVVPTVVPPPAIVYNVDDEVEDDDDDSDNEPANLSLGMGPTQPIEPLDLDSTELQSLEGTINRIVLEAMDKINKCNGVKRLARNRKYTDKNIFLKLHGLRYSVKVSQMMNKIKEQEAINRITKDNLERVKSDIHHKNNLPSGSVGSIDNFNFNINESNYNAYLKYLQAENMMNLQKINMIETLAVTKTCVVRPPRDGYTECPICQDEKANESFVFSSECIHAICKSCFNNLSPQQRVMCTTCRTTWTHVQYFERKNAYLTLNKRHITSRRAVE